MNDLIEQAISLGVGVGQISDAMDELGLPQNAGGGYRVLGGRGGTVLGRAFTLRQVVAERGQASVVRQGDAALELASPGDILVIDAGGRTDIVTWGEGHSLRAQVNGLAGVVAYGATRDTDALATSPLPVLCLGSSPVRSKGRLHTISIGEPISVGGVRVAEGDLIAMGSDGLACIPKGNEIAVLEKALSIFDSERIRDAALRRDIATRMPSVS